MFMGETKMIDCDCVKPGGRYEKQPTRATEIAKRAKTTTPEQIAQAALNSKNCSDDALDLAILAEAYLGVRGGLPGTRITS